ncbi:hypothetical protein NO995_16040 [Aestuariibaculum sp. M13]|uniref:hypothetical protein n=1 Tax=Aestuariibaculum sp. M13 TaxID=2967132 RepID=UPI002159DE12|nr:hypothetical protein [Aestuariibaculum sp. M13]MCR8669198.1 hypothetical protein [Aestuariibaculum sp. M13]
MKLLSITFYIILFAIQFTFAQHDKNIVTGEKIKKLLEIQWWNWDIERITRNVQNLTDNKLEKIIE